MNSCGDLNVCPLPGVGARCRCSRHGLRSGFEGTTLPLLSLLCFALLLEPGLRLRLLFLSSLLSQRRDWQLPLHVCSCWTLLPQTRPLTQAGVCHQAWQAWGGKGALLPLVLVSMRTFRGLQLCTASLPRSLPVILTVC